MYCSSCGTAVTAGLSYCNRCGAELSAKEPGATKSSELAAESLVWAIVSVTVVGLLAIIALMALLNQASNASTGLIIGFAMLSFLLVLATDSVFLWLLLRSKTRRRKRDGCSLEAPATGELGAANARALPEPTVSFIEHTTRTLEPIHIQRKAE